MPDDEKKNYRTVTSFIAAINEAGHNDQEVDIGDIIFAKSKILYETAPDKRPYQFGYNPHDVHASLPCEVNFYLDLWFAGGQQVYDHMATALRGAEAVLLLKSSEMLFELMRTLNAPTPKMKRLKHVQGLVFIDPSAITDFYFDETSYRPYMLSGGFGSPVVMQNTVFRTLEQIDDRMHVHNVGDRTHQLEMAEDLFGNLEHEWLNLRRDVGFEGVVKTNEMGNPVELYMRVATIHQVTTVLHGYEGKNILYIGLGDEDGIGHKVIPIDFGKDEAGAKALVGKIEKVLAEKRAAATAEKSLPSASPFSPVSRMVMGAPLPAAKVTIVGPSARLTQSSQPTRPSRKLRTPEGDKPEPSKSGG